MAKEKAVLVGAGSISVCWFDPLVKEKIDIVGVVDLDLDRAKGRIQQYELDGEASDNLKATLKKTRPDFGVDCTVPEAHCAVTCTALRAGCHVVGEKPMAAGMAEARRMVKTARQTRKMYMVSQSRRWQANEATVATLVAGKQVLGALNTVNCDFFLPRHDKGFRARMPSPLIVDMSIHHFDLIRFMTGLDPVAVYAKEYSPKGSWYKGDVAAVAVFEMTRGVVFTYRGSWCSEGFATSWNGNWRIIGDKGTLLYEYDQIPCGHVAVGKPSKDVWYNTFKDLKVSASKMPYGGMHGALRELLAYIRTGKRPQTHCADNIKSLAMVHAVVESARKGRRVPVRAL